MGIVENVAHDTFPEQSSFVGNRTEVMFYYDGNHILEGTVVRDDREGPWKTIIKLDDGRYVLGAECQWSPRND